MTNPEDNISAQQIAENIQAHGNSSQPKYTLQEIEEKLHEERAQCVNRVMELQAENARLASWNRALASVVREISYSGAFHELSRFTELIRDTHNPQPPVSPWLSRRCWTRQIVQPILTNTGLYSQGESLFQMVVK